MNYQILNRVTKYQGRAFDVQQVELGLPDGRQRVYDLVDHRDSVSLVPVDGQGNILFVRQFRLGAQRDLLELPAGVLEAGETPEEGARREIREETGMAAGALLLLGEFYLAPGYANEKMSVFLATGLNPDPLNADDDEFLALEALSTQTAYQMAERGEIPDSKTLAALFLARPHLGK
jgi:ADP-ribose pyrophosphatase